jgi:hypothetical protein
MKTSLFNIYSEVYTTALMQDVKHVAIANKTNKSRFGALVKFLRRG